VATFADRLIVFLADPNNLPGFLGGMNLGASLTTTFQNRFNTEFWQVAQVATGAIRRVRFEQPTWVETRLMGREEHLGSNPNKTLIDYRFYGQEVALWTDLIIELDTTWQVDQFPGSIAATPANPATFGGLANLVSVLRLDANNRPLGADSQPLAASLDPQGRLQSDPPNPVALRVDPLAGALARPDGSIFSLVQLALFPQLGLPAASRGAPLGTDGQPLRGLLMDHQGNFTRLDATPAPLDPLTGLPLDSAGNLVRPVRLTTPEGGTVDTRFFFSLPVDPARQVFSFVTQLHLFVRPELNLVDDLRAVLALGHWLGQTNTALLSLSDPANRQPHALALAYENTILNGSGIAPADVRRLGEAAGVLIHFFAIP
jgi:hypothetical protein